MSALSPLSASAIDTLLQTSFAANLDEQYGSVNLGAGSPMASMFFAIRQLALQLQGQVTNANNISRLVSSASTVAGVNSTNVDSFVAPFGFTRLSGTYAQNSALIGTTSIPSGSLVIPAGAIVQRVSDGVQYMVIADPTQPTWSPTAGTNGGYVLTGATTLSATLQCLQVGTIGNMPIGTAMTVYGGTGNPLPPSISVVTVNNTFTNGVNEETDAELIERFQIQGGFPKYGTISAILSAVAGVQPGLVYQYGDYITIAGAQKNAYFVIVVNAGNSSTGASSGLLAAVKSAVDAVRCGGIQFDVFGPTLLPVTINASFTALPGYNPLDVAATMTANAQAYVNGIGLNADGTATTCSYAKIVSILLNTTGVSNVTGTTVNGGTADLTANFGYQFVSSSTGTIAA